VHDHVCYDERDQGAFIFFVTIFLMSVGAEVGEYFECPRFIFEVAPISWSWSCCTCSRWCYTRQCFEGSSSGL